MGLKANLKPADLGETVAHLELESFLETTRSVQKSATAA